MRKQTHDINLRAFTLSVDRARFDVDRARRQYDAVEPENRLVARTLERSLETTLTAQRQTERDLLAAKARRPVRLSDKEDTVRREEGPFSFWGLQRNGDPGRLPRHNLDVLRQPKTLKL